MNELTGPLGRPINPITRRSFIRKVGTVGVGLGALGALVGSCARDDQQGPAVVPAHMPVDDLPMPDPRRPPGPLVPAVSTWMLSLFPIEAISDEWDREVDMSGWVFDIDEFVSEGVPDRSYWASMRGTFYDLPDQKWLWDLYLGMAPFVEMATLVDNGLIEPWDPYLPSGFADAWIPSVRDEATYDGEIYSYPFGANVVAAGWHAGIVETAGLDPEYAPPTWDEWIFSAREVMDSGAAPFGATFNPNGWLSLAPIAHSIDSDIYTEDGLFDFTHEAVVEALEIMRRLVEVSNPDVLDVASAHFPPAPTTVEPASVESPFATERVAYYFDHVYAPLNMSTRWSEPSHLRINALPSVPGGAGGTVFWSFGAGLFIDGRNKALAAEYMHFLTRNARLYLAGIGKGRTKISLLQPYETVWEDWRVDPPWWLPNWVLPLKDQLTRSRAIPISEVGPRWPHWKSGVSQFHVGRPHWETYLRGEERDPRRALDKAKQAVLRVS